MIGRPRLLLVVVAVVLYALAHVVLAITHDYKVADPVPYYAGLVLMVGSCLAVLVRAPTGLATPVAVGVVAAVVAATLLVVVVLPEGRPSYAMWYPSLVAVPMGGVVLRGLPVLGVVGAATSAAVTLWWSALGPGWVEGLYRVTTPTAAVVVCVGVGVLMRRSRVDVDRAHAERVVASEFAAAVRVGDGERADRMADVARLAAPVLSRLADGETPGRRLVKECRLLESGLRDSIRGRGIVDAAVSAAAWAARARGVRVVLLDDAGHDAPVVDTPARRAVRAAAARSLEAVSSGVVTVRLVPQPDQAVGTVVVVSADAALAARAVVGLSRVVVEVGDDEVVLTVPAGLNH